MILNDRQLEASQNNLNSLNASIARIETNEDISADKVKMFELNALKGFSNDMQREIDEYTSLRSGNFEPPRDFVLSELPKILIQTRLSQGWSQLKLAWLSGLEQSQISCFEDTRYELVSFATLMRISNALNVDITRCSTTNFVDGISSEKVAIQLYTDRLRWEDFPIDEVFKLGWIKECEKKHKPECFVTWLTGTSGDSYIAPYRIRNDRHQSIDECALFTWRTRILHKARSELQNSSIPEFEMNERWLTNLAEVSIDPESPSRAKELLREQGILLIIEKNLANTQIDGAALLTNLTVPTIALTLEHDRLDYFWYMLFRELGHIYWNMYEESQHTFIDQITIKTPFEIGNTGKSVFDKHDYNADCFVFTKLLHPNLWDSWATRFSSSKELVLNYIKQNLEGNERYSTLLSDETKQNPWSEDIIGHGKLHLHFEDYL